MTDYVYLATELGIKGTVVNVEYRAHCPMHDDSNPSFSLNIQTGLWMCHARCGSGEFPRLVQLVLGCNPQEAWDWIQSNGRGSSVEQLSKQLAEMLGQNTLIMAEEPKRQQYWREVYDLCSNKVMPMWFLKRGFAWETIYHWDIRYNNLQDAVIIPVRWQGELVGTVSRNTKPNLPKYQNSPGIPGSKILFGEISKGKSEIIICEGVLDALWLWQLGYHAVSLLGSHISKEQVEILRTYRFGEVTLALDNDEAGQAGTEELVGKLAKAGWLLQQIKLITFPEDVKDPQDCSPELFSRLYTERKDVIHGLKFA